MAGVFTNEGLKTVLDRFFNESPSRSTASQFKVGVGVEDASSSDTNLSNPIPISGAEIVDSCDVLDNWSVNADCTATLNGTTYKSGTACIDVTKDDVNGVTAQVYKTTTSRDLGNKDFSVWVYVDSQGMLDSLGVTALDVKFGSDSSNYFWWQKNKSDFSVGWNLVNKLNRGNASIIGSPVTASCDYTSVGLVGTASITTWGVGSASMDDIKVVSASDYTKSFESGYPTLNYDAVQGTIRCRLSVAEANGYPITEFGVFNKDSTALLQSRDVFTSFSKTSDDELILISKILIE